jgi:hypothetical protein
MMLIYKKDDTVFSVEAESLPAVSVAYLMQYGWAQSLQDSIAGAAKAKRSDLEATDAYKNGEMDDDELADEIDLFVLGKLEARAKAIREGTVGARVSEPRDPVTKLAREQVLAALKAKGKKVDLKTDDGKAIFEKLVAQHVEKSGDAIRAEVARRKAAEAPVEIDLD